MSFTLDGIIPVVPSYHPTPPTDHGGKEDRHTHISSTLESVGRVWLAVHEMPEQAYPSLPRMIPVQIALGDMEVDQPVPGTGNTAGDPDQPSTPRLPPPPDGMMVHPSPMRLAPFIVDQQTNIALDEVFTPTPTKSTFAGSQDMLSPDVRADGLKARKESSTLGLAIDETLDAFLEESDKAIQTAKHGSPSRAHMVRLSPLSPMQTKDLFDGPESPSTKQKLRIPLLPKIKVQFGESSIDDQPKSPFEAYSPLIAAPPPDATLGHDDDASQRRTSYGGTTDRSRVGAGMTPSLAEIMDRVGVTAQRNRFDVHD